MNKQTNIKKLQRIRTNRPIKLKYKNKQTETQATISTCSPENKNY